ncbi:MAG: PD-(D/E)XK nuclease family protein [Planctomycetes bacterium]|nr:PD-(D/E)XK nuclease family protein [Planctomycetota bacterium]
MSIRFVIGRAGTGKTHHCVEAVRNGLRQDPIDGPRLVLLVPEQAGLQMERAILKPADIPAAHRAEVLSFRRLACKILDTTGTPSRTALSEPARAMVLRYLLHQHAGELRYYRRLERLGGFVEELSRAVAEFMAEAVPPEMLGHAGPTTGEAASHEAKLHDLRLIYAAYLAYLGTDRLDPTQYLQLARERIGRCRWLHGARVWVDGFASLSGQEMLMLAEVARLSSSMEMTLLLDPDGLEGSTPRRSKVGRSQPFHRSWRTFHEIEKLFQDAGIKFEPPLILRPDVPHRFRGRFRLTRLEGAWFAPGVVEESVAVADDDDSFELCELPSRRIEARFAVSKVCQWTQRSDSPLRYRDIAIIVRDLEPYHDLLSAALEATGIPYFIDRRRPIAHHPLVELLRACVLMIAEDLSLDSVRLALKTGLLPLSIEAADELENYLLAHGLTGRAVWRGEPWTMPIRQSFGGKSEESTPSERQMLDRVNEARGKFLGAFDSWLEIDREDGPQSGKDWADAIRALLDHLGVHESLAQWASEAQADGDIDQAEEHEQVYTDIVEFLSDMASAFEALVLSPEDLSRVLEAGLSGLTLGLAPPMVDQVLVGSIERSRHPDIKAAVILGFNDGVFPSAVSEDAILNDEDRRALRQRGIRIGPPSTDRVLDEIALAYIALTRAGESCVVTYAAADNDGKALRPSPYVQRLKAVLPHLTVNQVADPCRMRETWDILSPRDLAGRLAREIRDRPSPESDDQEHRTLWNGLYSLALPDGRKDPTFRRAMSGLGEVPKAQLSLESVERLYEGPLRSSVSELETYAACPFQHFAKYTLRLRERAECELEAVDVGQLHHAILEDVMTTLVAKKTGLHDTSEEEVLSVLQSSCGKIAMTLPAVGVLSDARNAYVIRRTASQLARILRRQRKVAQSGKAKLRGVEIPFGFTDKDGLPPLTIATPAGRQVHLRGFIDRVDLAELGDDLLGIVIDYKRTRDKRLNMGSVYHGLSLQLVAYLLALAEKGETLAGRPIRPLAALYVSLASHYEQIDHPTAEMSSRNEQLMGTFRPRGLIAADKFAALDPSAGTGWSEHYSVYVKKDGSIGQIDRGDAVDGATMDSILERTKYNLGRLADGILDGHVDVRPYRLGTLSPCSWCSMASVCRFEMGLCDVRFLDSLKRSEVFDLLAGQAGGGSTASSAPVDK